MMRTKVTELLGIQYPILQGAMAAIAEHTLAAAVSEAGGLGIIAGANAPADIIRKEIQNVRELTDKPFGVNVMLLSPHTQEVAQVIAEERVPVVTTGGGSPEKFISAWKNAGVKVIPVIASVAYAKKMEHCGADAVIAEGTEAGGHIGPLGSMPLIPQVVDAVCIPVLGAGGIADGRGVSAAFMLGAEGVQIGTRFLVAKECLVHERYKNRILTAKDIDSTVTGRSHGHPVRTLRNQMTREYQKKEIEGKSFEELEHFTFGALRKAAVDGDILHGSVMAGQIAGLVKSEQTCREIVEELVRECCRLIQCRQYDFIL